MTHIAKHTPGPWAVDVDGRMIEAQLPNLRNEYEHICDLRGDIKGQINIGNAHLIAAAPAMYEALQEIDDQLDQFTVKAQEELGLRQALIKLRAALAQAEGRG